MSGRAAGLTLVEALVAATLLVLVVVAALGAWVAARRGLARTATAIELQQAARVALDRIGRDLSAAGYRVDPDGAPGRPDEAIEGAFPTVVVVRADLDEGTADAALPETELAAGGAFSTVSTGSDEIVAWALASSGSTDRAVVDVDTAGGLRDGVVEPYEIRRLARIHDRPPYTLYRIALDDRRGAAGSPVAPVRTPVVDGVADLRFVYFDERGSPVDGAGGSDAATATCAGRPMSCREVRRSIRRIRVELTLRAAGGEATTARRDFGLLNVDRPPPRPR